MVKKLTLKTVALLCVAGLLAGFSTGAAATSSPGERIEEAIRVLREMSEQPDAESMGYLLQRAKGVAIFPSVIKVGLMLGGRYGEGLVLRRNPNTGEWYGPAFVEMKGVSYGVQFGIQSIALVLVITNERGLEGFQGGKITLGGDLSIAAGPVGRHAEAKTDLDLKASIYSYSMSKGVFAGLSLEGAAIEEESAANNSYWGTPISPSSILNRKAEDQRIKRLLTELESLMNDGV